MGIDDLTIALLTMKGAKTKKNKQKCKRKTTKATLASNSQASISKDVSLNGSLMPFHEGKNKPTLKTGLLSCPVEDLCESPPPSHRIILWEK